MKGLVVAPTLTLPIDDQKACSRCAELFRRPEGWSWRKWAHVKLCPSCEAIALRVRIESYVKIDARGCWLWQKSTKTGYGQITVHDLSQRVHSLVYQLYKGRIPSGFEVCHECDVRRCCNPEHLFLGTRKDNMQDCKSKGRMSMPPKVTGERHHKATLSDAQVAELRAMRATGISQRKVAAHFGVTQSAVWNIVHYRSRKAAG